MGEGRGRTPEDPDLPGMMRAQEVADAVVHAVTRPRTHRVLEATILPMSRRLDELRGDSMAVKVTIIGGGSSSFVPLLIRRLMQSEALGDAEVSLMDIDAGRLERDGGARRQADRERGQRHPRHEHARPARGARRRRLRDRRDPGGGMDAWANDLEIPARYGIVHARSATRSGRAGSCARSATRRCSRRSPRNVAEVAPDAWVFNYTNPAPIEALAHAHRCAAA